MTDTVEPACSKTRTVLTGKGVQNRILETGDQVKAMVFAHDVPETPDERCYQLFLPVEQWKDLGEPSEITVTIRPGDRLNT